MLDTHPCTFWGCCGTSGHQAGAAASGTASSPGLGFSVGTQKKRYKAIKSKWPHPFKDVKNGPWAGAVPIQHPDTHRGRRRGCLDSPEVSEPVQEKNQSYQQPIQSCKPQHQQMPQRCRPPRALPAFCSRALKTGGEQFIMEQCHQLACEKHFLPVNRRERDWRELCKTRFSLP